MKALQDAVGERAAAAVRATAARAGSGAAAAMAAASARVDEYYLGDDGALPPEARSLWRREPRG